MSEAQLPRIEQAWRQATDYDVASALNSLDDYASEAVDIIKAEARRRQLRPEDAPRISPPRTYEPVRKILVPTVRFFAPRRWLAAALVAVAFEAALFLIPPPTGMVSFLQLTGGLVLGSWACLASICWPLRSHRLVIKVTATFAVSMIIVGFIRVRLSVFSGMPLPKPFDLFASLARNLVGIWVVTSLPLCGLVWWRNRFRPIFPPGHCAKCGYNLRGLPEPRCPECGTPFKPAPAKS